MRELSLFTDAGGGILGSKLLGWQTLGYVEWEEYPQKIIAQRIKDGIYDEAPIFTDVREFAQSGAARQYRGLVDVVTAGFPCQPFSVAGKQLAAEDKRNMWLATCEVIEAVRPPIVYLENTPGLVSTGYIVIVIRDLERMGYRVKRPLYLGADDVGAPHKRKRVWVYASNSNIKQCQGSEQQQNKGAIQAFSWPKNLRSAKDFFDRPDVPKPLVRSLANDVANGSNQLKATGNGQVPLTMATAYAILSSESYQ